MFPFVVVIQSHKFSFLLWIVGIVLGTCATFFCTVIALNHSDNSILFCFIYSCVYYVIYCMLLWSVMVLIFLPGVVPEGHSGC